MADFLEYDPMAGENIEFSCKTAIDLSIKNEMPVRFVFNGIELIASRHSTVESLLETFHSEMTRRVEEYENSPEYQIKQEQRRVELEEKKVKVRKLLEDFDSLYKKSFLDNAINVSLKGKLPSNPYKYMGKMIDWIDEFAPLADDIGISIEYNPYEMASKLEMAGFIENEGVGYDKDWFDTKEKMGRYIIGQVINCLKKGMPPHPITSSFIEKYRQLERKT